MDLIRSYKAHSPEERLYQQAMLDFAAQHSNCFERSKLIGHFTASALLLNKAGDKALLMHHKKLDQWFQLGGHADGDSDLLAVALKEAQEESGIRDIKPVFSGVFDLDIHELPETKEAPRHFHYDVRFLLQVKSDEQVQMNQESKELRWIGKNTAELPTTSWSVVRLFKKWATL